MWRLRLTANNAGRADRVYAKRQLLPACHRRQRTQVMHLLSTAASAGGGACRQALEGPLPLIAIGRAGSSSAAAEKAGESHWCRQRRVEAGGRVRPPPAACRLLLYGPCRATGARSSSCMLRLASKLMSGPALCYAGSAIAAPTMLSNRPLARQAIRQHRSSCVVTHLVGLAAQL